MAETGANSRHANARTIFTRDLRPDQTLPL